MKKTILRKFHPLTMKGNGASELSFIENYSKIRIFKLMPFSGYFSAFQLQHGNQMHHTTPALTSYFGGTAVAAKI